MTARLRHKLTFYGTKRLNFRGRSANMTHFTKTDGSTAKVRLGRTDGIVFGYMVEPRIKLLVFKVQDVLLDLPVRVAWRRVLPDGRGPSPQGKRIDEIGARALLDSVIAKNSSQRAKLRRYYGLIRESSKRAAVFDHAREGGSAIAVR